MTGAASLLVGCLPLSLESLDRLTAETLVLFPPSDERPLKGAAGFCDWRLCGRLSRLVENGWYGARRHEMLLMDSAGRLPVRIILVMGLGPLSTLDLTAMRRTASRLSEALRRGGWRSFAGEIPPLAQVKAEDVLQAFFQEIARPLSGCEFTLLHRQPGLPRLVENLAPSIDGLRYMPSKPQSG
jgi:hypothetical protein